MGWSRDPHRPRPPHRTRGARRNGSVAGCGRKWCGMVPVKRRWREGDGGLNACSIKVGRRALFREQRQWCQAVCAGVVPGGRVRALFGARASEPAALRCTQPRRFFLRFLAGTPPGLRNGQEAGACHVLGAMARPAGVCDLLRARRPALHGAQGLHCVRCLNACSIREALMPGWAALKNGCLFSRTASMEPGGVQTWCQEGG